MQTKAFALLLISVLLPLGFECCLFRQGIGDQLNTTLTMRKGKLFKREIFYKDKNSAACECGTGTHFFYLAIRDLSSGRWKSCLVTPVASNLLLTSHRCLMVTNGKIPLYENWDPLHGLRRTFASKDVRLYGGFQQQHLSIRNIIYHPQFTKDTFDKFSVPDNDVVVIVTMENIFEIGLDAFCLPEKGSDPTAPFYTKGEYGGVGGEFSTDETVPYTSILETPVMKAEDCVKEGNFNVSYTENSLCVRFRAPGPQSLGGSLSVYHRGQNPTTFLVGLANIVDLSVPKTTVNFAFFTNILPHIKYIEDVAAKYDSKWCVGPKFELPGQLTEDERFIERYDWEPPTKIPPRDESLDCVCGLRNEANLDFIPAPPPRRKKRNAESRIAGGEYALSLEFPWMILVEQINGPPDVFWGPHCGASIINDRVILTAGHCVLAHGRLEPLPPFVFRVWAQMHFLPPYPSKIFTTWFPFIYTVEKIIMHPDYIASLKRAPAMFDSDIALLVLNRPLNFDTRKNSKDQQIQGQVRPVCLPTQEKPIDVVGMTAILPGFGTQNRSGNDPPQFLKKGRYPVRSFEECTNFTRGFLTRNMICATTYSELDSALKGDSGGPISVPLQDGLYTQIGLTSFGDEPRPDNHPEHQIVYYTNVQRYLQFINYHSAFVGAKWCRHHEL